MNMKQDQIIKKLLEKIEKKDNFIKSLEKDIEQMIDIVELQKNRIKEQYDRINELENNNKDCEEDCKDCEYSEDCDKNREKEYEDIEAERLIKEGHSDQCAVNQAFAGSQCNCKKDWYFIFGGSHAHPNGYVKIFDTFNGAREEMFRRYGPYWCTQHDESYMAKIIKEYDMHEVE